MAQTKLNKFYLIPHTLYQKINERKKTSILPLKKRKNNDIKDFYKQFQYVQRELFDQVRKDEDRKKYNTIVNSVNKNLSDLLHLHSKALSELTSPKVKTKSESKNLSDQRTKNGIERDFHETKDESNDFVSFEDQNSVSGDKSSYHEIIKDKNSSDLGSYNSEFVKNDIFTSTPVKSNNKKDVSSLQINDDYFTTKDANKSLNQTPINGTLSSVNQMKSDKQSVMDVDHTLQAIISRGIKRKLLTPKVNSIRKLKITNQWKAIKMGNKNSTKFRKPTEERLIKKIVSSKLKNDRKAKVRAMHQLMDLRKWKVI